MYLLVLTTIIKMWGLRKINNEKWGFIYPSGLHTDHGHALNGKVVPQLQIFNFPSKSHVTITTTAISTCLITLPPHIKVSTTTTTISMCPPPLPWTSQCVHCHTGIDHDMSNHHQNNNNVYVSFFFLALLIIIYKDYVYTIQGRNHNDTRRWWGAMRAGARVASATQAPGMFFKNSFLNILTFIY